MKRRAFGLELTVDIVDGPDELCDAIQRRTAVTPHALTDTISVSVRQERARPGFWLVLDTKDEPLGHADNTDDLASFIADRFHHALFDHCVADSKLVVHAGVVSVGDRAILIPGTSHSGKSTLVTALVEAGAGYLSDEFAVLDQDGRVWPYPRPIAMRAPGSSDRPSPAVRPPPKTIVRPLPVGLIIETSYHADRTWQPQVVTGSAAVLPLLANAAGVRTRPDLALSIGAALSSVPLHRGPRGEATTTAAAIVSSVTDAITEATATTGSGKR